MVLTFVLVAYSCLFMCSAAFHFPFHESISKVISEQKIRNAQQSLKQNKKLENNLSRIMRRNEEEKNCLIIWHQACVVHNHIISHSN